MAKIHNESVSTSGKASFYACIHERMASTIRHNRARGGKYYGHSNIKHDGFTDWWYLHGV